MSSKFLVSLSVVLTGAGLWALSSVHSATVKDLSPGTAPAAQPSPAVEKIVPPIVTATGLIVPPVITGHTSSLLLKSNVKDIKRLNLPNSQTIQLQGVVDALLVQNVVNEIKSKAKKNTDLYLLINSPGGSVLDGAFVLSAIEASKAKVHTVCIGMCASMAFMIHQHGATRLAVDRSILMAHPASGSLSGTLEEMESLLSTITRFTNKMDAYIAKRSGTTAEAFKSLYMPQFWIDAEDAKLRGYVDGLVDVYAESSPISTLNFSTGVGTSIPRDFKFVW